MLEVDRVSLTYEGQKGARVPALEDLSFHVGRAEFVVLCGASGCGKSTILRLVAGLVEAQSGRVSIEGRPIVGPSPDRGIVFQSYNLFPWLSVRQNIEFSIRNAVSDAPARRAIVDQQIAVMGLEGFEESYPATLSGGMRQRVAIARTLALNPMILLLDEPFGALDPMTRQSLQGHLQAKATENGWTVLFVTHDVDEAILLGDRVLVLSRRPARVVDEQSIPFDRPRPPGLRASRRYAEIRYRLIAAMESTAAGGEESDFGGSGGKAPLPIKRPFRWSEVLRDNS